MRLLIYNKLKMNELDGGVKKENLLRSNYMRVKKLVQTLLMSHVLANLKN
jgi:hypothetical protein